MAGGRVISVNHNDPEKRQCRDTRNIDAIIAGEYPACCELVRIVDEDGGCEGTVFMPESRYGSTWYYGRRTQPRKSGCQLYDSKHLPMEKTRFKTVSREVNPRLVGYRHGRGYRADREGNNLVLVGPTR